VIGPARSSGHALALSLSTVATTAGTLPSGRVVLHVHPRYYDPLGLPLHGARLRLRLIRATSSRQRLRRRISRVPHSSFNACCAPYPGEISCSFFSGLRSTRCCLRRDMSGSALSL